MTSPIAIAEALLRAASVLADGKDPAPKRSNWKPIRPLQFRGTSDGFWARVSERVGHDPAVAVRKLGEGQMGGAYFLSNGRVLKVTSDGQEATSSFRVMKSPARLIARIWDVFRYELMAEDRQGYCIVMEKLRKAPTEWQFFIDKVGEHLDHQHTGFFYLTPKALEPLIDSLKDDLDFTMEPAEEAWLRELCGELDERQIEFADFHSGNVMQRDDGTVVMIDLGVSRSPAATMDTVEGGECLGDSSEAAVPETIKFKPAWADRNMFLSVWDSQERHDEHGFVAPMKVGVLKCVNIKPTEMWMLRPQKRPDVENLLERRPLFITRYSDLESTYHGKGIGMAMYLKALEEIFRHKGEFVIAPDMYLDNGETSAEATAVWRKLLKLFPNSSNFAILVDRIPANT